MNNIRIFSNTLSKGVLAESVALKPLAEEHAKVLAGCATLPEYLSRSMAPSEYRQLLDLLPSESMKILDIGVGRGESSLFLSSLGHKVFAVEPSEDFCHLIKAAADKFGMPITICQGVAEDLDRLGESNFDVVIFNSSLHHCDDPCLALRHSNLMLRGGGHMFLVSELFIRPWVSKSKFYRLLDTNPVEMGHYGGNEHAYYNWEYIKFLTKAGFVGLKLFPTASIFSPLERLSNVISLKVDGRRIHSEMGVLLRAFYYIVIGRILLIPFLFQLTARLSVVSVNYTCQRYLISCV